MAPALAATPLAPAPAVPAPRGPRAPPPGCLPAVRATPSETPSGARSMPLDAALTPPLALHTTVSEWLAPLSPTPALVVPSTLGRALRRTPQATASTPATPAAPHARLPCFSVTPHAQRTRTPSPHGRAGRATASAPSAAPLARPPPSIATRAVDLGRGLRCASSSSPPRRSELVKAPPPLATTAGSSSRAERHFSHLFRHSVAAIDRYPGRLRR
nr:proline-rich receptor-like protein kinase PERK2 [Aegilops tauschii subsp. strangulata]